eukprot:5217089-Pyramimonas_sp.AAC.1
MAEQMLATSGHTVQSEHFQPLQLSVQSRSCNSRARSTGVPWVCGEDAEEYRRTNAKDIKVAMRSGVVGGEAHERQGAFAQKRPGCAIDE